MYNRYIRNDRGVYTKIPEDSPDPRPASSTGGGQPYPPPPPSGSGQPHSPPPPSGSGQPYPPPPPSGSGQPYPPPPPSGGGQPIEHIKDSVTDFLRNALDRFHLDHAASDPRPPVRDPTDTAEYPQPSGPDR